MVGQAACVGFMVEGITVCALLIAAGQAVDRRTRSLYRRMRQRAVERRQRLVEALRAYDQHCDDIAGDDDPVGVADAVQNIDEPIGYVPSERRPSPVTVWSDDDEQTLANWLGQS